MRSAAGLMPPPPHLPICRSWVVAACYAPPAEGAAPVVHAATVPWGRERGTAADITRRWAGHRGRGAPPDLRLYARGAMASPLVTSWRGAVAPAGSMLDAARGAAWAAVALAHSLSNWPLRRWVGERLAGGTRPVPAAPLAYDTTLAAALWDASAAACGTL